MFIEKFNQSLPGVFSVSAAVYLGAGIAQESIGRDGDETFFREALRDIFNMRDLGSGEYNEKQKCAQAALIV